MMRNYGAPAPQLQQCMMQYCEATFLFLKKSCLYGLVAELVILNLVVFDENRELMFEKSCN
jgi:hypothetical protein